MPAHCVPCLCIVSLSFTTVFISFALDFYIVTLPATTASRAFATERIWGQRALALQPDWILAQNGGRSLFKITGDHS